MYANISIAPWKADVCISVAVPVPSLAFDHNFFPSLNVEQNFWGVSMH